MINSDTITSPIGRNCRRFHLWDATILVAAIGVGIALAKVAVSGCVPGRPIPASFRLFFAIECGHAAAFPCVAALTMAFLPIRLRQPRPPLTCVLRQPGLIACCTSISLLAFAVAMDASAGGETSLSSFIFVVSQFIGTSVAIVWVLTWLSGCWSPDHDWVDGLGRVLGTCWIVLPLILYSAFLF